MHAFRLTAALVSIIALAGCGSGEKQVMPDVTGERLDVALSDIERAGFEDEVDVVGGGLFGVIDESNWEVCEQAPAAGDELGSAPRVTVDRSCDDGDGPAESPSESPSESATPEAEESEDLEPSEPATPEALTVKNNRELRNLLTVGDYCAGSVRRFASKYEGRTIEFDGNIAAMANHGDYTTRYDILVSPGDYSETTATGPSFQFRDVSIVSDLNLTGKNIPDAIGRGDNLRVVAEVVEYEPTSCLFLLDPVVTRVR